MFIGNWRKAECPTPTFRAWGSIHSTHPGPHPQGVGQGVGRAYHTKPHILQYYALHTNTILRTLPRLDVAVLHKDHQQQLRLLARRSTQACSHPPTRPHTDMIQPTHPSYCSPPAHPPSDTQDTQPIHPHNNHLVLLMFTYTRHPTDPSR